MADDAADRDSEETARINVNEPSELRDWSKKLRCSEELLRQAVAKVGTSPAKVQTYLKQEKPKPLP
jgi:hypothetical protein